MSEDTHSSKNILAHESCNSTAAPQAFKGIPTCDPPGDALIQFELSQTRRGLFDLEVTLHRFQNSSASRERALAITKIQEAIFWLVADLNRRGVKS